MTPRVWADGYGLWHADAETEADALAAIRAELAEREGPNFAPETVAVTFRDGHYVETEPQL